MYQLLPSVILSRPLKESTPLAIPFPLTNPRGIRLLMKRDAIWATAAMTKCSHACLCTHVWKDWRSFVSIQSIIFARYVPENTFPFPVAWYRGYPLVAQKRKTGSRSFVTAIWGPDYDAVGAITLLHAFADSGYRRILATVASTRYEGRSGCIACIQYLFKRPSTLTVCQRTGIGIKR